MCSHDAYDVTRRQLIATHSTTNDVEEIIADLVNIILLKKLHFTLYKYNIIQDWENTTINTPPPLAKKIIETYLPIDVRVTEEGKSCHTSTLITVACVIITTSVRQFYPYAVST